MWTEQGQDAPSRIEQNLLRGDFGSEAHAAEEWEPDCIGWIAISSAQEK